MSLNFDASVLRVLDEIERFGLTHDPTQTDWRQKMLNLERPTAKSTPVYSCRFASVRGS